MIHPLLERELRRGSHSKAWAKSARWLVSLLYFCSLVVWAVSSQESTVSRWMFFLGVAIGTGFAAHAASLLSSGLLESESQNHVLELVVLSGIRPSALIASRMAVPILVTLQIALTAVPFLLVGPTFGHVSRVELFIGAVLLFGIPLFIIAAQTLSACLAAGSGDAQAFSGWLTFGPFGLAWILTKVLAYFGLTDLASKLFIFSPLYVFGQSFHGRLTGTVAEIISGLSPVLLGLAYLAVAAQRLTRVLREPRTRWIHQWRHRLHRRLIRSALRRAEAPYQRSTLLGMRSLVPAWFTMLAIVGCWVLGALLAPQALLNDAALISAYLAMLVVISIARALALVERFAIDRSGGHFELLLAAGVHPEEIVQGSERAVVDGFRPLVGLLLGLGLTMAIGAVTLIPAHLDSWIIHGMIWTGLILISVGFLRRITFKSAWVALWTGRPFYALSQSALMTTSPLVAFQFFNTLYRLFSGSVGEFPQGTATQWGIGAVLLLIALVSLFYQDPYRPVLIRDFRAILTEHLAVLTDPRFANWDTETAVPVEQTAQPNQ
jgi:hypothetical protein